jgi:hypothetical protein
LVWWESSKVDEDKMIFIDYLTNSMKVIQKQNQDKAFVESLYNDCQGKVGTRIMGRVVTQKKSTWALRRKKLSKVDE